MKKVMEKFVAKAIMFVCRKTTVLFLQWFFLFINCADGGKCSIRHLFFLQIFKNHLSGRLQL